jgi:hypothetical protein
MTKIKTLSAIELRLLVRDPTLLVFAFAFAPFVMLILAGVFGAHPSGGYGGARPDRYYVAASTAVPIIALALIGLPVTLASHRERGVLKRFEAFGVSTTAVIAAEALVTVGLVAVTTITVLAVAAPTYGAGALRADDRRSRRRNHDADPDRPRRRPRGADRARCPGDRAAGILPAVPARRRRSADPRPHRPAAYDRQRTPVRDPGDSGSVGRDQRLRAAATHIGGLGRDRGRRDRVAGPAIAGGLGD